MCTSKKLYMLTLASLQSFIALPIIYFFIGFSKKRENRSLSPSQENPLLKNCRRPFELLSTVITYFVFNLCSSLIFYSSSRRGITRSKVFSVVLLHLCSFDCISLSFAFACEYLHIHC